MAGVIFPGIPISFEYTAADMNPSLSVAMKVYDVTAAPVLVETIAMAHIANGTYVAPFTPTANKSYMVNKMVYTDPPTYAITSGSYSPGSETFHAKSFEDSVWNAVLSGYTIPGSAGKLLNADLVTVLSNTSTLTTRLTNARANNLDLLDAAMTSRASQSSMTSAQDDLTALVSRLTALRAANLDSIDATITSRANQTDVNTLLGRLSATRAANLDNLDVSVSSRAETSGISTLLTRLSAIRAANLDYLDGSIISRAGQVDINTLLTRLSLTRAANLDYLDSAISTASANVTGIKAKTDQLFFSGSNVLADAQVVADKVGYGLSAGQVLALINAIWNEPAAYHPAVGSTGKALSDAALPIGITPTELQNIANAVWDEARSAHTVSNTFGEAHQGIISGSRASALDLLDAAVTSRASQSSVAILALLDGTKINNLDNLNAQITTRATQGSVDSVKIDTLRIPLEPSTAAAVAAIPTNPLLTTDSRLSRLDVPISSRTAPVDLAALATNSAMTSGFSSVGVGLGTVLSALATKPDSAYIDSSVAPLATSAAVLAVGNAVAAVAAAQISVASIWTYAARSLTSPVDVSLSLAGVALTSDVTSARDQIITASAVWKPKLTLAIDPLTDIMDVATWLTKNEVAVLDSSESSVDFYDSENNLVLSLGPDLSEDSNGVFKFTRANASLVMTRNKTYTCKVRVTRALVEYSGLVPITVF